MDIPLGCPFGHTTCWDTADKFICRLNGIWKRDNRLVREWFSVRSNDLDYQLFTPWGIRAAEDHYILQTYFYAFSKIFFGDALNVQNCLLRVFLKDGKHERQWYDVRCVKKTLGRSQPFTPSNGVKFAVIDIYQSTDLPNLNATLRQYLGTLLHEMTHAYLSLFVLQLTSEFQHGEGTAGHGSGWMRITYCIEKFCSQVLGLPVDLNRTFSLEREIMASGIALRDVPFCQLDVDTAAVKKYVEERRALMRPNPIVAQDVGPSLKRQRQN